ncbi:hypothetical protein [Microvirus mar49]|uniref:Uncharacterized protein n=1 Tax=Microvirus mar49 TaxID=2851184 RepID=A0A8F6AI50_9VIRU|nr:hypothetical protein [Microvirus mar49]
MDKKKKSELFTKISLIEIFIEDNMYDLENYDLHLIDLMLSRILFTTQQEIQERDGNKEENFHVE